MNRKNFLKVFWGWGAALLASKKRVSAAAQPKPKPATVPMNPGQDLSSRLVTAFKYSATPSNIEAVGNELVGVGNGQTTKFALATQPYQASLQIFKDGLLMCQPGDYSYQAAGPTNSQIVFTTPPAAAVIAPDGMTVLSPGETIYACYLRSC